MMMSKMLPNAYMNGFFFRGGLRITSLSEFKIDMVSVNDGDIVTKAHGTPAVQVNFTTTTPSITSARALPVGAYPGFNASPPFGAQQFDFDNLATGDNVLTIRIVAGDGITTQDHSVTIRVL